MLTQLPIPIPLSTPKGKAWAVAIIDYGPHWDLLWVAFVHDSGECWTFSNQEIRQEKNYTFGIYKQSPIPTSPIYHSPSVSKDKHENEYNGYNRSANSNFKQNPNWVRPAANGDLKNSNGFHAILP